MELGEDICEKQKQYKWDANFMKRLSLDLRAEFPQSEGFSRTNLYDIKRCFAFYSSQIEFVHQTGGQLQEVDDANLLRCEGDIPSIGILLCKDKDSSVVEWSLRGITTPLGVASYQLQEVYERTLLEIKQEASEEEK